MGDQLSDSNVAYTLHFYSSMHKQPIRNKASTALSNGAAIFVTEWGTEQKGEGNFDETNTWLEFLRQHGISNANWGIYDKDSEVGQSCIKAPHLLVIGLMGKSPIVVTS